MTERFDNNIVKMVGTAVGEPYFSHANHGNEFYIFGLMIERLSGVPDIVKVVFSGKKYDSSLMVQGNKLEVLGQIRSYNNKTGEGNKLVITVLAQEIRITDEEDTNLVSLSGTICKPPIFRQTPLGREICDILLAVNRKYGRADYLPCILWGHNAYAAAEKHVGDTIKIEGRLQSRKYTKVRDGESEERTAFEISVMKFQEESPKEDLSF